MNISGYHMYKNMGTKIQYMSCISSGLSTAYDNLGNIDGYTANGEQGTWKRYQRGSAVKVSENIPKELFSLPTNCVSIFAKRKRWKEAQAHQQTGSMLLSK